MSQGDHTRVPCPWVILTDFGAGFTLGTLGGGVWHGPKDARDSTKGSRLTGSITAIKTRAPMVGGHFGIWSGLFSTYDCAIKGYRQKDDAWNAIISGSMTGGTLALRSGPRAALGSAFAGGLILSAFAGVETITNQLFSEPVLPADLRPSGAPLAMA